jgi:hypothetical protein
VFTHWCGHIWLGSATFDTVATPYTFSRFKHPRCIEWLLHFSYNAFQVSGSEQKRKLQEHFRVKRPLSVWFVQILFALVLLVLIPALLIGAISSFDQLVRLAPPMRVVLLYLGELGLKIAITAFFALASISIWQRKPSGRVLGLVGMIIIFSFLAYTQIYPPPSSGVVLDISYDNAAQRGWASIFGVFLFISFWVLFWRFGFTQRTREFFHTPIESSSTA